MVLVVVGHKPGGWLHSFYSPPPDDGGRELAIASLTLDDSAAQVHLGNGDDPSIIAACLEIEAALAVIRQQAQAHHALGWTDPLLPEDVPLAIPETELRALAGDR